MTDIDKAILLWIQEYLRFDWLTPIVKAITHLGDKGIIWIVIALILCCMKSKRLSGAKVFLALILCALITNVFLKNVVARVRPYDAYTDIISLLSAQVDFSFPSGHTASGIAAVTVLLKELPRKYAVPLLILAILIMLSRLYLGVHYPTDIIGGIIVGIISGLLSLKFFAIKGNNLAQ